MVVVGGSGSKGRDRPTEMDMAAMRAKPASADPGNGFRSLDQRGVGEDGDPDGGMARHCRQSATCNLLAATTSPGRHWWLNGEGLSGRQGHIRGLLRGGSARVRQRQPSRLGGGAR
jgi:hypothetical protein